VAEWISSAGERLSKIVAQMAQITIQQAFDLALQHHRAGRLGEAEKIYRQILAQQPNHADAMRLLGVIAHQRGRAEVAVDLFRRAITLRPAYAEAHTNLGTALKDMGQLDEAIAASRQAIILNPQLREAHTNLANALKDTGRLDEAIAAYRQAVALDPNLPEAHSNLGNVLRDKGRLDEAIAAYRQAIALRPGYAEAHSNLGNVLRDKKQFDEAIVAYRQAIALNPNLPQAYVNLGNALKDNGHLDEAIAACRQAIALDPDLPQAHVNLGNALKDNGQLDQAIAAYRQAIALRPGYAEAHNNLGIALKDKGRLDEAITAYRQAIALRPGYAEAYSNLCNALREAGQLDEAIAACRQAIVLNPQIREAHISLGNLLKDKGQLDEAIAIFRQAIALNPNLPEAHSNLAFTLHYHPGYDARAIAEEHRLWNRQHAEPLRKFIQPHTNDRDPDRRLRIGYVSPDFRSHAVGLNLLPLFHHHDRKQFEITCYAQTPHPDAITAQFQQHADRWRNIVGRCDGHQQVADLIRQDGIDILVDLALHTANNHLLVFARKPAPVQATFAGYPGSTGLSAIDYRFSDPYLDPIGMDESVYSERTIRLADCFWCYDPLDCRDIPVNALPALRSSVVTFGCLNNFCKFNDDVLELWAKVMRQVDNSRLLSLAPPGSHRSRILERFQKQGIDPGRIEFVTRQSRREYLETYHRIDLGLDTFPYNGHTTSLDSLWMGVPVVSIVGDRAVARAGWCQLSNLGLGELAGQTAKEFVRLAVELAKDLHRLEQLRSTLRRRMEQSPLMDAPKFARNIEAAYRRMWRTWCETASTTN
jgi:predicted O-linked N-acetylglucosamine transferase (SPINDLY family)